MKTLVPTDLFLSRLARVGACLLVAGVLWLPLIHLGLKRPATDFWQANGVSPAAERLADQPMPVGRDPILHESEIQRVRQSDVERDFMGRTFLVWSLANLSLRDPGWQRGALPVMDSIIRETLVLEGKGGLYVFEKPYAHDVPVRERPLRSLLIDGGIALMLAAREAVAPDEEYRRPLLDRMQVIESRLRRSPLLGAGGDLNECWTFDHAVALAALRVGDAVTGEDHLRVGQEWLNLAKAKLVDPKTGLLVSRYTMDGETIEGPEISSLWMVSHGRTPPGFGYAREWPAGRPGEADNDSGRIVPVLGIGTGSRGLAFVGAIEFRDLQWLEQLHATLDRAGFPVQRGGRLRFAASNRVGNMVLLDAATREPLSDKARKERVL